MKQIFDSQTNSTSPVMHSQESWLTISSHGFRFDTITGVSFQLAVRSAAVNTDMKNSLMDRPCASGKGFGVVVFQRKYVIIGSLPSRHQQYRPENQNIKMVNSSGELFNNT